MLPFGAFAAVFEHDLYVGIVNNQDVKNLQEFLHDQKLYDSPITGNFFSLTKQAVIALQEKEGITPAQGYFGPKTRSRANMIMGTATPSREEQIGALMVQIHALQAQLADLIAKQQVMPTPTSTPLPSPSLTPSPTPSSTATPTPTTTPTPVAELRISGSSTQSFPNGSNMLIKLGDITIVNTTAHAIYFNKFKLDIYDSMNSTVNRGKTVLFKLRNGTTTSDDLISETKFDINNTPPALGTEIRRQLDVSFPMLIKSGQTYVSSLWLENLDYVTNGSLRVLMLSADINDPITPQGGFTFVLTR